MSSEMKIKDPFGNLPEWKNSEIDFGLNIGKKNKTEKKEIKFKCRICGCTEYDAVFGDTSFAVLGGKIHPTAYQCKYCSVMFKDPEKFSDIKQTPKQTDKQLSEHAED